MEILLAVFREDDVKAGAFVSSDVRPSRIVRGGGPIAPESIG